MPAAICLLLAAALLVAAPAGRGAGEAAPAAAPAGVPWEPAPLPGAVPIPPELAARYRQELARLGPAQGASSRHRRADGRPAYANRLLLESSPYLLEHAHNPVDWRPWGEEAFAEAVRLDRPVLLSIGYSTCHWCHVMAEESFEDEEIAALLNREYIAIKVDREERPDLDAVYLAAVQALGGGGGWPLTVWLTPRRRPYFGGTYFPPRDGARGGEVGFLSLLRQLGQAYRQERERVEQTAAAAVARLAAAPAPRASGALPATAALDAAFATYLAVFDPGSGGVRGAPKFPSHLPVRFLLREWRRRGDSKALEMAVTTLDAMAAGGIHDQLGGGFHRYATDAGWRLPHFEKMLYDQALLAVAYLEAFQATGEERFAAVARDLLAWVERDLGAPDGGFHAALDADSPAPDGRRVEGWFYTWTEPELVAVLGSERAALVARAYGVASPGEPGAIEGRTVLHRARPDEVLAAERGLPVARLQQLLAGARADLLRARAARPAPRRDDKLIAAWNGLAISAFARAALALGEERYAVTAARAADLVLGRLRRDGRLRRSLHRGVVGPPAVLDDHAFLAASLLDLFEASGERRWLAEAIALDRVIEAQFEDRRRWDPLESTCRHASLSIL